MIPFTHGHSLVHSLIHSLVRALVRALEELDRIPVPARLRIEAYLRCGTGMQAGRIGSSSTRISGILWSAYQASFGPIPNFSPFHGRMAALARAELISVWIRFHDVILVKTGGLAALLFLLFLLLGFNHFVEKGLAEAVDIVH